MSTQTGGCGKRTYRKKDARAARNRQRHRGAVLRIYQCPRCNLWHLTHDIVGFGTDQVKTTPKSPPKCQARVYNLNLRRLSLRRWRLSGWA